MSDRLTKEQAREFIARQDKDRRRPPISESQQRRELGRDLIDDQRAERERRNRQN